MLKRRPNVDYDLPWDLIEEMIHAGHDAIPTIDAVRKLKAAGRIKWDREIRDGEVIEGWNVVGGIEP